MALWCVETGQTASYWQITQSDSRCIEDLMSRHGATAC